MIDIHSHILPCMDDGAASVEMAIGMAELAAADGIRVMIATPHATDGRFNSKPELVIEGVRELNLILQEHGIPITVCAGQEIRVNSSSIDDILQGETIKLNYSRYVLLEFPSKFAADSFEEVIYEFKMLHYVPVIAHPERNPVLANQPQLLYRLTACGALSQVNAASVTGANGAKVRKAALKFIRHNLVHFIASDAHDTRFRPPGLQAAYREIAKQFGQYAVDKLQRNSQLLLDDLPFETDKPSNPGKRWFAIL